MRDQQWFKVSRSLFYSFLALGLLLCGAGCGYRSSFRTLRTLAIPIFQNQTSYTRKEYDLTQKVQEAILNRSSFLLASPDEADYELEGTIESFNLPVIVEAGLSQPIVSEVSMSVKIKIMNLHTHKILYAGTLRQGARFATSRGESPQSAEAALYEKISMEIVNILRDIS